MGLFWQGALNSPTVVDGCDQGLGNETLSESREGNEVLIHVASAQNKLVCGQSYKKLK